MFDVNIAIITELKTFLGLADSQYHLLRHFCTDITKDFSRRRGLPFGLLVLFITKLCKRTLSLELEQFFAQLNATSANGYLPCTTSAYCQQRKKIDPCFFVLWNEVLWRSFYHYSPPEQVKRWRGLRLIAVDGSSVALPNTEALAAHFGGPTNRQGSFVVARTCYYYDVLNALVVDALIVPYRVSELAIAYKRIEGLDNDTLSIYDRNFSNYIMVALHRWQEQEKPFIIRAKGQLKPVKEFIGSGQREALVSLFPSDWRTVQSMRKQGFVVQLNTAVQVRLIRVELPAGGVEVLMTNLMAEDGYHWEEFSGLYALRWNIETAISLQKNILMLESFSGRHPHTVEQDFYATVFVANLQSLLMRDAQASLEQNQGHNQIRRKSPARKHPLQVNRNKASARIKGCIVALFISNEPLTILKALHACFIKDTLPVRKGRRFERRRKSKLQNNKHRTFTNYKPV